MRGTTSPILQNEQGLRIQIILNALGTFLLISMIRYFLCGKNVLKVLTINAYLSVYGIKSIKSFTRLNC